jgi:hypothetical protein
MFVSFPWQEIEINSEAEYSTQTLIVWPYLQSEPTMRRAAGLARQAVAAP